MVIKPGKPVKLRGSVITRLESMKNTTDSYSEAISKLMDVAEVKARELGLIVPGVI